MNNCMLVPSIKKLLLRSRNFYVSLWFHGFTYTLISVYTGLDCTKLVFSEKET